MLSPVDAEEWRKPRSAIPRLLRHVLIASLLVLGITAGLAAGLFSLDAQAWIYGPLHRSGRYGDVGGAFRGLIEGLYATVVGGAFGARVAWLLGAWLSRRLWGEPFSMDRLGRLDLLLLPPTLVWWYLIWASW